MKKGLNQQLRQAQDKTRQNTVKTIEDRIKSLQAEGFFVTIAMLMEHTGFSRGLFQKTHVDELLKKYKIGKYRNRTVLPNKDFPLQVADKEITKLSKEMANWKTKCETLQARIDILEQELKEKNEFCERLKGEIISIHNKARDQGIKLNN